MVASNINMFVKERKLHLNKGIVMEDVKQTNGLEKPETSCNVAEQQANSLKRFMRHYLDLFPLTEKLSTADIKKASAVLKNKDLSMDNMSGKILTIVCKATSVKSYFAFLLTKLPYLSEAKFLTLTDILDMQFNNHPVYSSIRDVRTPIILIYIESITNRLKDEYLLKAVEFWCMKGQTVWIYFKGQVSEWTVGFPKTVEFAKLHRFSSCDLNQKSA